MTDYKSIFESTETQNWFRCAAALTITREVIKKIVEREITQFHHDVLNKILTKKALPSDAKCGLCTTQSVVPCPFNNFCKLIRGKCSFHKVPPTTCSKNICNSFVDIITEAHKNKAPSWKNTDASKWFISPWELAKCYFPPDGYSDITSANKTDFNGLVSALQNCTLFGLDSNSLNVCAQVRQFWSHIFHQL